MNVSITTQKLLEILRKNRASHEAEYAQAFAAYHRTLKEKLNAYLMRLNSTDETGEPIVVRVDLPVPQKHLDEYDRSIRMVGLDTRAEVVLNEDDARRYLDDDWDWQHSFKSANAFYGTQAI